MAEVDRERLYEEYAAELVKMKKEAKGRQKVGGKKAGRGRPQKVPQQIGEPIDKHAGETIDQRARAAGTNRWRAPTDQNERTIAW